MHVCVCMSVLARESLLVYVCVSAHIVCARAHGTCGRNACEVLSSASMRLG